MDNRTIEEVRNNETKLIKEIEILEEENQELKKQLSNDHQIKMKRLQQENRNLKKQLSNSHQMKNQQKVFMQWLEQNIENEEYCYLAQNPNERCRKDVFEEALSKYKEIIGGSNANISRR